jgi:hypothetical protein
MSTGVLRNEEMGSKIQEACYNGNGKSGRLLPPTQ